MPRRDNLAFGTFLFLGGFLCGRRYQVKDYPSEVSKPKTDFESNAIKLQSETFADFKREGDKVLEKKVNNVEKLRTTKITNMELENKNNATNKQDVVAWSKTLAKKGLKISSQNDEDGVIEAVFDYIGTSDKVYVEFGVESCNECNSRYLRYNNYWIS